MVEGPFRGIFSVRKIKSRFLRHRLNFRHPKTIMNLWHPESEVMNLPRTGRPPAENPKNDRVSIRFTKEQFTRLDDYCKRNGLERAEAIRMAVEKMLAEEKRA